MIEEMMTHHYFAALILMALAAVALVRGVQRLVNQEQIKQSNDVTGAVYNMIGVLLALILGFLIVEAYSDYSTASSEAQSEATQLILAYRMGELFDEPQRTEIQAAVIVYMNSIHDEEWPGMTARVGGHPKTNANRTKLWLTVRNLKLNNEKEITAYDKLVDHLGDAAVLRNERLRIVHEHIPRPLWYLFFGVAIVSILFLGLFGNTNPVQHRIMAALVALVLGSCIFLIEILDNPYKGPLKIEPDAFLTNSLKPLSESQP